MSTATVSLVTSTVAARNTAGLVVVLPPLHLSLPAERFNVHEVRELAPGLVSLWGSYPDEGDARGVAHFAAGAALTLSADQIAGV